ncbi:DUF3857 domain-containing protein [Flavihumibacter solisilvae]|uniref:DUF3857 domain-containing protein n=1 Tax=Flavihumibacter solisilvae TaxID=1349421 RepID=A0A0C1L195_9BACT|nr:DUF3857 domain-containing protein [Flavihumibacter solisilvae]KIC93802.1 hypothetical protein OI18_15680 [Flavihumibacter solisilvae]
MRILRFFLIVAALSLTGSQTFSQHRISKKEADMIDRNLSSSPLLIDDADFKESSTTRWPDESGVILCQKTTFDFDKKGLSVGKRIGRNVWGVLFALPTFGASMYAANARNDTRILVEETERRKILLKDKAAIDQYSVLYFRLSMEDDAFAARVIKADGSIQPLNLEEAIKVDDVKSVPGIFQGYTDFRVSSVYRPSYYKIAVPDLTEGDIIEYAFRHINTRQYGHNPSYKEFDPVYYLCNREMPVARQVIEVVTQDDKYHIGYKSLKGAPDFMATDASGNKVYKWVDNNRDKLVDTKFVNEFLELPSIKFQIIYARNSSRNFIWFADETAMKKDITPEELSIKARTFWFSPEKLQATGDYTKGLNSSIENTTGALYKLLRKRGAFEGSEDEYVQKVYYTIRSMTIHETWSDYAFAKIMSGLLTMKRIPHEIIASTVNNRTDINKVAFTQEIAWMIRYKNRYFANPDEHLNPDEIPVYLAGNTALRFNSNEKEEKVTTDVIPMGDTLLNTLKSLVKVSLDVSKATFIVTKESEASGLVKQGMIDEVLALTPFLETDFRNYDGVSMWDGLSATDEEKATMEFNDQKKEWKEEKPKVMKSLAESEYGHTVEKYDAFRLVQDGRNAKKRGLRYTESFTLSEMTSQAGSDLIISLPVLMGEQSRIKKEERQRTLPIDIQYPRSLQWKIICQVPAGYTPRGLENLNKTISNEAGSFVSTATVENNAIHLAVKKTFRSRHLNVNDWNKLLELLDASFNFSESKIILVKQ